MIRTCTCVVLAGLWASLWASAALGQALPAPPPAPPPAPGQEADVTATGYGGDLMEPFEPRDGRHLLFTRWQVPPFGRPQIWQANRLAINGAFGPPDRPAIGGYAEAPTLSPDDAHIYFQRASHRKTDDGFRLFASGLAAGGAS
ncbi:MAG TPA: hypothetical protein EYP31_01930 [Roseibacterium sp.]|nr:hypothetical protein [Roseibacterium sp.]